MEFHLHTATNTISESFDYEVTIVIHAPDCKTAFMVVTLAVWLPGILPWSSTSWLPWFPDADHRSVVYLWALRLSSTN